MSDKKDKPNKNTTSDKTDNSRPSAKDTFGTVADFADDITREFKGYTKYFGKGTFMKDAAGYVRKHGKDRLKAGAATTAKVAATTWKTGPLLKYTLPAAFAVGAIGGPKASKYVADKIDDLAAKFKDEEQSASDKNTNADTGTTDIKEGKPPTPKDP